MAEHEDFLAALDAFDERLQQAAKNEADDSASRYLEQGNRWNPMIDAISTYVNGCELDGVSVRDTSTYEDTRVNWRVRRGYGALIAAYGSRKLTVEPSGRCNCAPSAVTSVTTISPVSSP